MSSPFTCWWCEKPDLQMYVRVTTFRKDETVCMDCWRTTTPDGGLEDYVAELEEFEDYKDSL